MMASSSSSSDLSNAADHHHHHLLPQAQADDDLPWPCPSPSSSLPFPQQLGLGGQWSQPALMQLEQLSSDELEALLHSAAQYHHTNIQSQQQQLLAGAAPAVLLPHGQLSSSLLMMQELGFQWSPAALADATEALTSQQQDALLKEEEEEEEEEVDNPRTMRSIVDAYSDSAAAVVLPLPSVNVSLLSASDGGGGDPFEMSLSSSSSPARLCRSQFKALPNSSSSSSSSPAVLVHNGVPPPRPPLLRLREQYGVGGGPHRLEALPSMVHSYSKMGSNVAAAENNGDAHMNGGSYLDEQQMQVQVAISKTTKKPRLDTTTTIVPSFKVRKEKLGDRIIALQQLVSPFGKTDTASVLMEAIGYIKFLQDQVETLSGPYMQRSSRNKKPRTNTSTQQRGPAASNGRGDDCKQQQQQMEGADLRSRGLCLVPLSCTSYVTNENAVWPPPNFRGN